MNEMERDLRDLGHRFWSDDSALRPQAWARGGASRRSRSVLPSGLIAAGTAVFLVVVLIGGILITRSRTSTPTPAVVTGSIESLQMLSPSDGWAWSHNLVARTSDGGATFDVVTPAVLTPALEIWSMTAVDIDHAWVVVTNAAGPLTTTRLYRTVNGGLTWVALPFTVKANWITEGPAFIDSLHGWALAVDQTYNPPASDAVLLRTVDGGESWSAVYETTARLTVTLTGPPAQAGECQFGLPVFTTALFGVDALTGCPGDSPLIEMTRDGGFTWQRIIVPLPHNDSPPGAAISSGTAAPAFTSPTTGSVFSTACVTVKADQCATYGAFFHTSDAGKTWSPTTTVRMGIDMPVLSQGDAWIVNACIGLCKSWEGTPSLLLHTDDGGNHWTSTPLASPLVLGGLHDSHAFQFVNAEDGFDVTTGEFTRPMFYRTTDGGVTWSAFTPRLIG